MWKIRLLLIAMCCTGYAESADQEVTQPTAPHEEVTPDHTESTQSPTKQHQFLDEKELNSPVQPIPDGSSSAEGEYRGTFVRTFLTLIGIILLIFLTIWLFRRAPMTRSKQLNNKKNIKVIESRQLSPKTMLYLVEVAGKQIVVSESHIQVEKLTTIDWLPDVESE
jgi:flagellar biosynthetic protein FliO